LHPEEDERSQPALGARKSAPGLLAVNVLRCKTPQRLATGRPANDRTPMHYLFNRIRLIFIGLFILAVGGVWIYDSRYVRPMKECEKHGGWWDERDLKCAHVVYLPTLTHRAPGAPAKAAQAPAHH
jgi:hypothetical protein